MMNKRDLKADLKLCNKVTSGPWLKAEEPEIVVENTFSQPIIFSAVDNLGKSKEEMMKTEDLEFIIQAREGWPHAIERALKAEADFKRQEEYSDMLENERNELYNLARELVEALEKAIEEVKHPICGPGSAVEDLEATLAKTKEVLGDD